MKFPVGVHSEIAHKTYISDFSYIKPHHFYRVTACNAMHGIAITILSVHPSVRCVYCDKMK